MPRLELPTGTDVLDAEKIIELLCIARLTAAQADESQVQFLGFADFVGGQTNGLLQTGGGLAEIGLHLPSGAQIGNKVEVLRVIALRRPQHLNRARRFTQANIQRAEIGRFVGRQLALTGELAQSRGFGLVVFTDRTRRDSAARLDRDGAQVALIEQETAPLRRQFGEGFARVIQSGVQRGYARQRKDHGDSETSGTHGCPFAVETSNALSLPERPRRTKQANLQSNKVAKMFPRLLFLAVGCRLRIA